MATDMQANETSEPVSRQLGRRQIMVIVAGVVLVVVLFVVALTLFLLEYGEVRVGWVSTSGSNHMEARYSTWRGDYARSIAVDAGDTLTIDYDVVVSKGTFTLSVFNADDILVEERIMQQDGTNSVSVRPPQNTRYRLVVTGNDTGGSYHVRWHTSSQ